MANQKEQISQQQGQQKQQQQQVSKNYLVSTSLASMTAQIVAKLCTHPIDSLKTKIQVQINKEGKRSGLIKTFQKVMYEEGIRGFYKGVFITALGGAPAFGFYMTSYQFFKQYLAKISFLEKHDSGRILISGILAEMIACSIFLPIDVVKERLQVQSSVKFYNYKNGIQGIKHIVQNEGFRGIYRGYWATICYFGPWSSLYFFFYENLKKKILVDNHKPTFFQSFSISAISGMSASCFVNWIDVVKIRLQIQRSVQHMEKQQQKLNPSEKIVYTEGNYGYKSVLDGLVKIVQVEGIGALFKGLGTKMLLVGPTTAIAMGTTESVRQIILKNVFDEHH